METLQRIHEAQKLLKEKKWDALWITDPITIFYLTGLSLSAGKMLLLQDKAELFVDGRYYALAKKKSPCSVSMYEEGTLKNFFTHNTKIGFDGTTLNYEGWQSWKKLLEKWEEEKGISLTLSPMNSPLKNLRLIKDEKEIASLRRSAQLAKKGFLHIVTLLKEGIEEKELAREFTIFCLKNGAERLSFEPIIAFGINSSFPHYRSGDVRLKKNDLVLMDLGVVLENYCSDMTRVVFHGKADPELLKIHTVAKLAHKKALSLCKPGTHLGKLDQAAREEMAKEDLELYFLHSLGHGVGLEIHEYPRIKFDGDDKDLLLQPGMVFTIEPGLYLPDKGGVRHEDTIVITPSGYENFYADLP